MFCLLILNCTKFEYKRQQQLNTWLKNPAISLWFHVRGNEEQTEEYIFDLTERILTVKTPDDYLSLPKKIYTAFKAIRETYPDITHILKTDDDMDCNRSALVSQLDLYLQYDYGGFIIKVPWHMSTYHYMYVPNSKPEPVEATDYATGRFYFVSARAVDHILLYKDLFWTRVFEDNIVGAALKNLPDKRVLRIANKTIFYEF